MRFCARALPALSEALVGVPPTGRMRPRPVVSVCCRAFLDPLPNLRPYAEAESGGTKSLGLTHLPGGGAASLAPARQLTPQAEKGDGLRARKSVMLRRKPAAAAIVCRPPRPPLLPGRRRRIGRHQPPAPGASDPRVDRPPPADSRRQGEAAAAPGSPARRPTRRSRCKRAIAAANSIDYAGYCTGGGHGNWHATATTAPARSATCSARRAPASSTRRSTPGRCEKWGERGRGSWITVYTNPGHAYVVIAGLRFDTSQPDDGAEGPGWSKDVKAGLVNGPFQKRHFGPLAGSVAPRLGRARLRA